MIIVLISVVLLLICASILVLVANSDKLEYGSKLYKFYEFIDDELIAMMIFMSIGAIIVTIVCAVLIIDVNSSVKDTIYDNKIKYYDICNRAENVAKNSTEEELVKYEIIEWNHEVLKYKSGYENPWVSWFFNKEVLDNLDYIEYPGIEVPEEIR